MSPDAVCLEMDALLAERASGALPAEELRRLDAHVATCHGCRAELARYEDTFAAVRESAGPLLAASGPDPASSTLRLFKRGKRRRMVGVAAGSAALAMAAAASLVLAPGLFGGRPAQRASEARQTAWEPDVDGALEASGLQRDLGQDEEMTEEDAVLAAFDAADQP